MTHHRLTALLACALTAWLAACAATPNPFTIPDGRYYGRATLHRYPVVVTKISTTQLAPLIEPGTHTLTLISRGPQFGHIPHEEKITLEMKPCMRYILAAQHPNSLQQRFTPLVDEAYAEGGCKV